MKAQTKIYTTLVVFIAMSLALIVFLIYPTFLEIKNSSREILSSREKTAFIYAQNQELSDFERNFNRNEVYLSNIEKLFIDPQNPVDFIRFLENTANDLNIELDIALVKPNDKESASSALASFFQVFAKGDFQDMLHFFEKLETGPYLLEMNHVSISKLIQEESSLKTASSMVEARLMLQVVNKKN